MHPGVGIISPGHMTQGRQEQLALVTAGRERLTILLVGIDTSFLKINHRLKVKEKMAS